ncbi:MAG: prepilin-type N-terminal cleavage/methylation domain-containing protein [Candidatus Brocadiales bacterium]
MATKRLSGNTGFTLIEIVIVLAMYGRHRK